MNLTAAILLAAGALLLGLIVFLFVVYVVLYRYGALTED